MEAIEPYCLRSKKCAEKQLNDRFDELNQLIWDICSGTRKITPGNICATLAELGAIGNLNTRLESVST